MELSLKALLCFTQDYGGHVHIGEVSGLQSHFTYALDYHYIKRICRHILVRKYHIYFKFLSGRLVYKQLIRLHKYMMV